MWYVPPTISQYIYYTILVLVARQKKRVTLKELHKTGKTKCPSVKALRTRAKKDLLVFIGREGATQHYDKQLSLIMLQSVDKCHSAVGVTLERIAVAKERANINEAFLAEQLNNGITEKRLVEKVTEMLQHNLRR